MVFKATNPDQVVAILQARMSSSRLPGKVLKDICGKPMLQLQLERLGRCSTFDKLVVATSERDDDDPIASLCKSINVACFRGNLDNVLDRFFQCAKQYEALHLVRLTGDCPLTDPSMIDQLVDFYFAQSVDYASNARPPTLPDGLDAEIFSFLALEKAWLWAETVREKEHVVPFIVDRPNEFKIANWEYSEDLSRLRWTVDEPEDFEFATAVFEALYPINPQFGFQDVMSLLAKQPKLANMNQHIERNAGSRKMS
ncbi:MAG: glycosyltransferase family protein [Rhizobiaceae bacterium]